MDQWFCFQTQLTRWHTVRPCTHKQVRHYSDPLLSSSSCTTARAVLLFRAIIPDPPRPTYDYNNNIIFNRAAGDFDCVSHGLGPPPWTSIVSGLQRACCTGPSRFRADFRQRAIVIAWKRYRSPTRPKPIRRAVLPSRVLLWKSTVADKKFFGGRIIIFPLQM